MILFLKEIQLNVSSGLLLVYGFIVFIIFLITVVLIVDKIHHKNRDSLFQSRHLKKRLKELQMIEEEEKISSSKKASPIIDREEKEKQQELAPVLEKQEKLEEKTVENQKDRVEENLIKQEKILDEKKNPSVITTNHLENLEENKRDSMNNDRENSLEKTQAQIDVEEITKALEKAVEEEKESNKYAKFEEEQEQNAIISYVELKEKFDELYDSNEKVQYMNDDTLPINLKELYETTNLFKESDISFEKTDFKEESPSLVENKPASTYQEKKTTEFRNSPIISPVYGIQKEKENHLPENKFQNPTDFLSSLKELQKNLE